MADHIRLEPRRPYAQLWPFLKPYRLRLLAALGLLALGSATYLLIPLAFRDLIDAGFGSGHTSVSLFGTLSLNERFLALFALACFWGLTISGRYYLITWIGERVAADLRNAVYAKVLRQPIAFFETLQTGEVLSRLTADTSLVQTLVGSSLSLGLRCLFQLVGGMIMLALTSLYLFSVNVGLMALLIVPVLLIGNRLKKLSRESQNKIADTSALAGEILNAVSTVQAYTRENYEVRRFAAGTTAGFTAAIRRTRVRALLTVLMVAAVMGAVIFVLWLGANLVRSGGLSGGQLASFIIYGVIVVSAVSTLTEVWGDTMRAAGAIGRLLELLNAASTLVETASPLTISAQRPAHIRFENVSFYYPSRPLTAALISVDGVVEPGESIALVGPSGAGKTTLFQLLQRFYEVSEGRILFNGIDIRDVTLTELRRHIAIVPQEPVMFSSSVMDNIRYGRLDASDTDVIAAAKAAQVDEFIAQLPEGYHTFLGERGMRLSGGQRQRIAIARAILKNAPLLLLDEATSALDAHSEIKVQQGLQEAMRNRTTLIIAHRLATVKTVDRIVVLEHGRIIETGTPKELLQQQGLYARLAALQFAM